MTTEQIVSIICKMSAHTHLKQANMTAIPQTGKALIASNSKKHYKPCYIQYIFDVEIVI